MIQIFNTHALNSQQRFTRALLGGIVGSIVIGLIYGIFMQFIHIESSLLLVAVGYCVGMVVQKCGRGVQQRFSVLGAVLCVLAILIADMVTYFGLSSLITPALWPSYLQTLLQHIYLAASLSSVLSIVFRAAAVGVAYQYSRIV